MERPENLFEVGDTVYYFNSCCQYEGFSVEPVQSFVVRKITKHGKVGGNGCPRDGIPLFSTKEAAIQARNEEVAQEIKWLTESLEGYIKEGR